MSEGEAEAPGSFDQGRMTLFEHLAELRTRLIRSILAVMAGTVVMWSLYPAVFGVLIQPYCTAIEQSGNTFVTTRALEDDEDCGAPLIVTDPLEGFTIRLKVSGYGGIALAMPVLLWQLWRFVAPGLYSHERRYAIPFVFSALVLFAMGAGLAFWTLPKALSFLIAIGGPDLLTAYSPNKYLALVTYMMLAFGVGFQFPIVLVFLQLAGILSNATLRKFRRYAIVIIFVAVAVITPSGDPISMLALALPMSLFYELAIVIGRLLERRRRRAPATP